MNDRLLKITFFVLSFLILATLALISRDAGISGDEDLHLKQSEMVYNYFATGGEDKSAINTPETHLKYYGQSLDNFTTILAHWFHIDDIYGFRHVVCSITGWLTILLTALFAVYLAGYGAGIFVLLLFIVSPFFIGHSLNNLKDIPFALAYIASIYFIIKFFSTIDKPNWKIAFCLVVSLAFALSIRAGGLLVFFYLWFFFILFNGIEYFKNKKLDSKYIRSQLFWVIGISVTAYLSALILWPYALQNPIVNPWKSYQVMADFPTTLRQIFEGQSYWSDLLPWYYLPKYISITIPIIVLVGVVLFVLYSNQFFHSKQALYLSFVLFAIVFPVVFVIIKKSNLYGSWRHFLFIYPCIILFSAIGFSKLFSYFNNRYYRWVLVLMLILLGIHPLKFMIQNHPYYYLYYNQIVGGLKGAYGNYETDYYYHSMREGSEWLANYLETKKTNQAVKVGANFSIRWFFRDQKNVETIYFPYAERSRHDWDYTIVVNSYIHPDQLKNKTWPPQNTIHVVYVDSVPICAVLERRTKDDYEGIIKFESGDVSESIPYLEKGLSADPQNGYLWYKYAGALYKSDKKIEAENALKSGLEILPANELILQFMGDIVFEKGDALMAANYYERAIVANSKFLRPYVKLANIYINSDSKKARSILMMCLRLNSKYKPAIMALADSYRNSDPEIAKKYDQLAKSIK